MGSRVRTADQSAKLGQARELVGLALKLARNCHASYRKASPETKKLWNQAFFEDIVVKGRAAVVDVGYAEPFRAIFAVETGRVSDKGLLVELAGHYQKRFPSLKAIVHAEIR